MSSAPPKSAIRLTEVHKDFQKRTVRSEYTSLKSELVRFVTRAKRPKLPERQIQALRGVNLDVPCGKTVGLIGRNGSGKSTLLKLITGIYRPTSGEIDVQGRISALLDLGAGFHPDFSGRENILINGIILGMTRAEIRARTQAIIDFAEIGEFVDEPVRTYSSGMYMRLAFSVATHVDPDILIVDEILAVGDEHFAKKSMAKMNEFKERGRTIVLVSHDLGTVERWCDLAAWLDGGKVRMVDDPRRVVAEYRAAVLRAEQQGTSPIPGNIALPPPRAIAQPTVGPPAEPHRRWGNYRVELERVQLLSKGNPTQAFDTEDELDIRIHFVSHEVLSDVGFALALRRTDGTVAYATTTFAEQLAVGPLPPAGTLRIVFPRLGLLAGEYLLDVSAETRSGTAYDFQKGIGSFTVSTALKDSGVARPAHVWELTPAPQSVAAPSSKGRA